MAAPIKTSRVTPSGAAMKDGFKSLITFSSNASLVLWERSVTPMGRQGGDPIPYDSMHNSAWHMVRPHQLKKGTDITMRCGYDAYATQVALDAMVNVEQTISQFFPSTAWCAFYGFLRDYTFNEHVEGSPPELTVIITPTFWDYINDVEAGPAFGTGT